jgi:preprotein translocase subunit SecG
MNIFLVTIHIIAAIALIAIVLLQTGKGAEMGAAFGGASQTLFGGSGGSTFMSKLTTGAAIVFMVTCLLLSYRPVAPGSRSIMKDVPVEQPQPAPPAQALPEARPVQPQGQAATPEKAPAAQQPAAKSSAQETAAQPAPAPQAPAKAASKAAKTPAPSAAPQHKAQEKAPAGK